MVAARPTIAQTGAGEESHELTPEEEAAWQAGLARLAEEKRAALLDPGPSWREWFFYSHAKWWVAVGFLIVDSWIATGWISNGTISEAGALATLGALVLAVYLEFLIFRLLWRRPAGRSAGRFRPGWTALREIGLWTPEAAAIRRGEMVPTPRDGSANPQEFL